MSPPRAVVLTVSDSASAGARPDRSGPEARKLLEEAGFEVVALAVVPDERDQIAARLRQACDQERAQLVVTTGGTGLASRDVTPEATAEILDREVPGMAELMRLEGLKKTPRAALSRGRAGVRASTLILNLPGSVKGVRESLGAVAPILGHAVEVLGSTGSLDCGPG